MNINHVNFYHGRGEFCHLLIFFTNSLAPDQDRRSVGPDVDSNLLTL